GARASEWLLRPALRAAAARCPLGSHPKSNKRIILIMFGNDRPCGHKVLPKDVKKRIAIFASGSGSNAQKIMEHFKYHDEAEVALVLSNNAEAFVLQRDDNFEVPTHVFDRLEFYESDEVVRLLDKLKIDLVVLAGFLWLVPDNLL